MWLHSLLARSSRTPARKTRPAPSLRQGSRCFRPRLETLEDRTLLSTYTVNSLGDSGAGSGLAGDLRYCIAHATSGSDTITFASGLTGTINLQSALPTLNASVDIQGPGAKVITVDGSTTQNYGFTVDSGAQVQISGLTMYYSNTDIKAGSATISNCTVSDAGLLTDAKTVSPGTALTVSNCTISGWIYNNENGAALTVSNCTLDGGSIANLGNGAALTVTNCTVSNGDIQNYAAGDSATISYTTLSGSSIENDSLASETISYSTISGDTGIGFDSGGPPDAVGAISNSGNLTINNSTISGNKAVGGPAYWIATYSGGFQFSGGNAMGGGIYMDAGTLSINSSTIADNEVIGGSSAGVSWPGNGSGGGLYIAGGTVSINNSTFADNQAIGGAGPHIGPSTGYGGGIYNAAGPSALQMHDTILAANTATVGPDLDGGLTSQGHNLIGNTSGGSGFAASDLLNVNPQLGPLQNNGGPTQTMALLAGSPAINAGDNTNAPAYDQRGPGFARIVGGTIDIGAFEVAGTTQPTLNVTDGGTYNSNPMPASATATNGTTTVAGSFTYVYYVGTGTSGSSLGSTPPTNVGTYTVVATFTSNDVNYASGGTAQTTFTITPATLTVTAVGLNNPSDGTTSAYAILSDNHLGNDQVTETYTSASFADPNVGNGKLVTVNGISISGASAGNYTLASTTATTTANITAAGTNAYTHDSKGRLIGVVYTNGNVYERIYASDGSSTATLKNSSGTLLDDYTYNRAGQLTAYNVYYSNGNVFRRVYASDGSSTATLKNSSGVLLNDYSYNSAGQFTAYDVFYPNGNAYSRTYNSDGSSTATLKNSSGVLLNDYTYNAQGVLTAYDTYYSNGNVFHRVYASDGSSTSTLKNSSGVLLADYSYNAQGAVTAYDVYYSNGDVFHRVYAADRSSTATLKDKNGKVIETYTYDAQGNLISHNP